MYRKDRLKQIGRKLAFLSVFPMLIPSQSFLVAAEQNVLQFKQKSDAEEKKASTPEERAKSQCKLGYFRKPWDVVLNNVAEETNSTLVMEEIPPGLYTRADIANHTREDAVRILNRDLEKTNFRLIENGNVLEVISTKKKKIDFQRHNASTEVKRPTAGMNQPITLASAESDTPATSVVQKANHENVVNEETAPPSTITIHPTTRPALDLAKQIHQTFKQRSHLENTGPHGLPAFVVDHFEQTAIAAKRPLFVLEIDTANNELLITAEPSVQVGLKQLITKIDMNPLGGEQLPKLVAGNGTTAETGRKLAQPLSLISQLRTQTPPTTTEPVQAPAADSSAPAGSAAPATAPQTTPESNPANAAAGGLPALLGNLKGDVAIEALNDLDLLILRGNEKDVESVLQVIQAIEQMAMGSMPEIHLLRLRFVDSQSMSQLLNDVYTRMSELRTNNAQQALVSVRVVPVVVPNAVLILAPGNAIEGVLDLADELDQAIDPTHEVQIFRLKHAVSTSVVEMLTNFYTQPPVGLATRLKVASDARTNSVVVQANPRDLSEIAEFIRGLDNEQSASTSRLRLFPLKSAAAEDLAAFLNNAIQGTLNPARMTSTTGQGGFGQQQGGANSATQQARATVLEFLAEGGDELIRSGLLNDIRFNADPRTNSLLVTASEQSMPLVEELIRMLDRPSSAVAEIKVFPLKNADSINAVALLNEMFSSSQQGAQRPAGAANQSSGLGMELIGAQGNGNSLIPMRFSADSRTNSVVAIGGADTLQIVEAILYKLDSNHTRNRITNVIKLRNTQASVVAQAINDFLAAQRDLATIDPDRISTSQLLEQEIIVTPEDSTNNLLISATPVYFKQLEEIARRLDAEPAQVVIQAMLVEVVLDNKDEFGVELGFQDPVLFARSTIGNLVTTTTTTSQPGQPQVTTTNVISQQATPGFNFNNQSLGSNNSTSNPSIVGSQGLTNFALGRVNNDLGYGGLVLSASSDAVSVLVRALAARRTLRVLSRPQIIALDNQPASIQVGQIVPVPDGVNMTTNGISQTNVLRDPAGIILTVQPRISPEGQVVMEVAAEKSAYPNLNSGVPIFTDNEGGIVYAPVKDITTANTTIKVPDGQTIVVGGMITKNDQTIERKVPWLGDLPVLGKLFQYNVFDNRRTELLIFLTPRIIHSDADMEQLKQIETGRIHFFQDDAESIHGPILGVPADMTFPLEQLDNNDPARLPELPASEFGPAPLPPPPTPQEIQPTAGARAIENRGKVTRITSQK
ncbi:secretin N-terminal domain-containing protein [Planctomicrobium sp. SH668]|uniref:secretin N-terminal domain-containing protein n=1 Tax=Planctomicrobium sp. SH668 TaxID=3448126 RepID=UPI003F5B34F0